jgi:hypothetical protein
VRDEIEEVPVSRHYCIASSGNRGAEDDIVVGIATHRVLEGDRLRG